MPLRRATVPLAIALGALAAGGCGTGADATDRVARDGVVRLEVREFRVDPQDWEVPAGRVRLVAVNRGRLAHNLAVETVPGAGGRPRYLGRTATALPGETVRARSRRLRPGTYRIACTLTNHDNLGEYGTLRVVAR